MQKQSKTARFLVTAGLLMVMMQGYNWLTSSQSPRRDYVISDAAAAQIPAITAADFNRRITESKTPSLVFIYASWCPYCRKEKPVIEQLEKDFEGKLNVLVISIDEDVDALAQYLEQFPSSLKTHRVERNELIPLRKAIADTGSQFTGGIPHSILLDKDGKLIDEISGYLEYPEFKRGLDSIF